MNKLVIELNIFKDLVNIVLNDIEEVKKEALWAISNATSGGNANQISILVKENCIKALCQGLDNKDANIICVSLEGLENILHCGELSKTNNNEYATILEENDCIFIY